MEGGKEEEGEVAGGKKREKWIREPGYPFADKSDN
jgi:hypothetical protein